MRQLPHLPHLFRRPWILFYFFINYSSNLKNLCYEENTAYYGNNLIYGHENPKKSRMDCQQSCQFNLNCNFWTFRKPAHRGTLGLCYLKTKRENVSNNVSSYVSGSKNCQLPEWTGRISKFDILILKNITLVSKWSYISICIFFRNKRILWPQCEGTI